MSDKEFKVEGTVAHLRFNPSNAVRTALAEASSPAGAAPDHSAPIVHLESVRRARVLKAALRRALEIKRRLSHAGQDGTAA